jgi:hypothetical protein
VVYPAAQQVALVDDRRVDVYAFDGTHRWFETGEELLRGVAPMTLADGRPALILGGERGVIRVWDLMAAAER